MGFGLKLKQILKLKNMSIRELSDLTNLSINSLYSITKRDPESIKAETLLKIADALEISPLAFYDNEINVDYYDLKTEREISKMYEEWKKPISDRLTDLIVKNLEPLNDDGKRATLGYIHDIADNPKYKKDPTE